eukprot:CAMPEP_0184547022 /NCGR_PEP_ID=MMETSP0199_2-20130426/5312_1 /TAXON_ID=1112570 /ORGANISM="Thraustochytrium sp., Strain LLF1b" /LENGTH=174 /DNA_ID=CAMNT_0026941469 /DNA_START=31 /DNA_END=551 /DNA_ORIENTATION=+
MKLWRSAWPSLRLASRPAVRAFSSSGGADRFQRPQELDASQQQVLDEIQRTRSTGLKGPFGPWLANPALAQAAQTLGRIVRYETSLPLDESELLILTTAKHHRSKTEWAIHEPEARLAGLTGTWIENIENKAHVDVCDRKTMLYTFAREVLETSHASDEAYQGMLEYFSETEIV